MRSFVVLRMKVGRAILPERRLKGGGTVESPTQLVEKPWTPHWAFITIGGPQAHPDSQDWLPHGAGLRNTEDALVFLSLGVPKPPHLRLRVQ